MSFNPNERYRNVFKEGMLGWDVAAIQIALNHDRLSPSLVEDGVYGKHTKTAVEELQHALVIPRDGVCGPETQSHFCGREAEKGEYRTTPKGLIRGLVMGESSGVIPTTSGLYANGSRDYGPFQDNKPQTCTEAEKKAAFNLEYESKKVATELAANYSSFFGKAGAKTAEEAWRLAILKYNWPAAAEQIALGHGETWRYREYKDGPQYYLKDEAPWIVKIEAPGVRTGWQWCEFYISSKTAYVTSYVVS